MLAFTNIDVCLLIAVILFIIAGVMRLLVRGFDGALVAIGLAFLAFAFIVTG